MLLGLLPVGDLWIACNTMIIACYYYYYYYFKNELNMALNSHFASTLPDNALSDVMPKLGTITLTSNLGNTI
jgi:hypothetical protein